MSVCSASVAMQSIAAHGAEYGSIRVIRKFRDQSAMELRASCDIDCGTAMPVAAMAAAAFMLQHKLALRSGMSDKMPESP